MRMDKSVVPIAWVITIVMSAVTVAISWTFWVARVDSNLGQFNIRLARIEKKMGIEPAQSEYRPAGFMTEANAGTK